MKRLSNQVKHERMSKNSLSEKFISSLPKTINTKINLWILNLIWTIHSGNTLHVGYKN
jgi:hypothetical protein